MSDLYATAQALLARVILLEAETRELQARVVATCNAVLLSAASAREAFGVSPDVEVDPPAGGPDEETVRPVSAL